MIERWFTDDHGDPDRDACEIYVSRLMGASYLPARPLKGPSPGEFVILEDARGLRVLSNPLPADALASGPSQW